MAGGVLALTFALILLLIAGYLWWENVGIKQESGLPEGNVIYADAGVWRKQAESLVATDIGLLGKPDYLIQQNDGMIIPVEVKSAVVADRPYDGHTMQLAAYCYLVEDNYGIRPDYGVLRYSNVEYVIDYTAELEEDLLNTLAWMREDMFAQDVARSHNSAQRCAQCGVRNYCDQRID